MRGRRHAPDRVADIVGHQKGALLVDVDTDRPAAGFVLVGEEARKPVRTSCGRPEGLPNAPIDIANKRFLRMVSSRRNAAGTMHRMGERSYDPHEFM